MQRQNHGDFSRGRLGGGGRDSRDDIPGRGFGSAVGQRVKPGKEIYRPPAPGGSWNIEAQEFKPLSPAPLTSSRSVDLSVKLDTRSGTSGVELDMGRLIGVFGKDMEE